MNRKQKIVILVVAVIMVFAAKYYRDSQIQNQYSVAEDENQQTNGFIDDITIEKVEEDTEDTEDTETYDITSNYYAEVNTEGLEKYVLEMIFNETEIYIQEVREAGFCEYIFESADGEIEIYLTAEQRENWLELTNENINETLKLVENEEHCTVELSKECTELKIDTSDSMDANLLAEVLTLLTFNAELHQVFHGVEDWSLHIIITNMENGKEMVNAQFPEESVHLSPDMW